MNKMKFHGEDDEQKRISVKNWLKNALGGGKVLIIRKPENTFVLKLRKIAVESNKLENNLLKLTKEFSTWTRI